MDEVKVMSVIYCTKGRAGQGTEENPIRALTEIFDLQGNIIMRQDPVIRYSSEDMVHFLNWYRRLPDEKRLDAKTSFGFYKNYQNDNLPF